MHFPPFNPAHHLSPHALPILRPSRPHDDVLFINVATPADHPPQAAPGRLAAVEDLLRQPEGGTDGALFRATAHLASALAPRMSEARQFYERALDRPSRRPAR